MFHGGVRGESVGGVCGEGCNDGVGYLGGGIYIIGYRFISRFGTGHYRMGVKIIEYLNLKC